MRYHMIGHKHYMRDDRMWRIHSTGRNAWHLFNVQDEERTGDGYYGTFATLAEAKGQVA